MIVQLNTFFLSFLFNNIFSFHFTAAKARKRVRGTLTSRDLSLAGARTFLRIRTTERERCLWTGVIDLGNVYE